MVLCLPCPWEPRPLAGSSSPPRETPGSQVHEANYGKCMVLYLPRQGEPRPLAESPCLSEGRHRGRRRCTNLVYRMLLIISSKFCEEVDVDVRTNMQATHWRISRRFHSTQILWNITYFGISVESMLVKPRQWSISANVNTWTTTKAYTRIHYYSFT